MTRSFTALLLAAAGLLGFALALATRGPSATHAATAKKSISAARPDAIAHDPHAEALSRIGSVLLAQGDLEAIASLPKLLDSLGNDELAKLLESFDGQSADRRSRWLPRIMAYWTRRDRAASTRWVEPRLGRLSRKSLFAAGAGDADTAMIHAWADNAPREALNAARHYPDGKLAENLLRAAAYAWPRHGQAEVLALLQAFPSGKTRRMATTALFQSWAQDDLSGAVAALASLPPGAERDCDAAAALGWLARKAPAEALQQAEALAITDPKILAATFNRAAQADPSMAAQWLDHQGPGLAPLQTLLVSSWARTDPAAAFAWAQAHNVALTDSPYRLLENMPREIASDSFEIRRESPIQAAFASKPEETLRWVRENMPAESDSYLQMASGPALEKLRLRFADLSPETAARVAPSIVSDLMRRSSPEAQAWASTLPPGPAREQAWTALGALQPELLPLPAGADRDAMLSGMAAAKATSAPGKSLDLAAGIADETLRHRAMDDVFWLLQRGPYSMGMGMSSQGPSSKALAEAAAWAERAAVPEAWKQSWRR